MGKARNKEKTILEKWNTILEHKQVAPIKDNYRKKVTGILLENYLKEAANHTGGPIGSASPTSDAIAGYDPILIALIRRAMPNLIAYDIAGVQPMTGPTGLIFAMRSKFTTQAGAEALFNEADTAFSGDSVNSAHLGLDPVKSIDPTLPGYDGTVGAVFTDVVGEPFDVNTGEHLGDGVGPDFAEMAFSIDKVTVEAKTRALKAEYTTELQHDLKAVHGLDAEAELANILAAEILAEINREVVRKINVSAKFGAQTNTATPGEFDLVADSNGRWSVERFKGLLFQVEREANQIAKETRRGKGNLIICSSDVASAFATAGLMNYTQALSGDEKFAVDDTGITQVGTIGGRIKVFIDPYFASTGTEYITVGYKGNSPYDAGLFYCPYVPLEMVRAIGENTFQPKIAFKTRYGMVANPFVGTGDGIIKVHDNHYYRIFRVANLM